MATDRHQAPSYPLRLPDELRAQLAEAAAVANRSLHAEMLLRLQDSVDGGGQALVVDQARQIFELRRTIALAHMELAQASFVLEKVAPDEKEAYRRIRKMMERTGPDAQYIIDRVVEDLAKKSRSAQESPTAAEATKAVAAPKKALLRRARKPKPG